METSMGGAEEQGSMDMLAELRQRDLRIEQLRMERDAFAHNFELLKELEVMDWAYFPKALPTLSPTPMKAYTVRPRSRTVCIAGRASGAF